MIELMQGKIVKGIAGFYEVRTGGARTYVCKARGIFRKEGKKPLVGDNVELEVQSENPPEGNIVRILARKNALIRPAVANIDQALAIFAVQRPKPNFNLLDRFLVTMAWQGIPCAICFNKQDEAEEGACARLRGIYEKSGCGIYFSSAKEQTGLRELRAFLREKTTAVAGPSGVGKSSLANLLVPGARMETGAISEKIGRGRHTTRHSELLWAGEGTYLFDTPGFGVLDLPDMEDAELKDCFPEFSGCGDCRFPGCTHTHEPGCAIKRAVAGGTISRQRYESYLALYAALGRVRKY